MTKERLEFYLNRKNVFGYNTENNDKIVAWIKLSKIFPSPGYFERFKEADDPVEYKAQVKKKNEPYIVNIGQVTREVFESDKYPGNEDYLLNVSYRFTSLDDVEQFLKELGFDLSEIKWRSDFDFL